MDDIVNIGMLIKDLVEGSFVGDIKAIEGRFRSRQQFNPINDLI